MSLDEGWFLDDIMEDLFYPQSKWDALSQGVILLLIYPLLVLVILPLNYLISFFMGFFGASPYRECDACGKMKLNNVRSMDKFHWFCEDCLKEYDKLEDKFIRKKKKIWRKKKNEKVYT